MEKIFVFIRARIPNIYILMGIACQVAIILTQLIYTEGKTFAIMILVKPPELIITIILLVGLIVQLLM